MRKAKRSWTQITHRGGNKSRSHFIFFSTEHGIQFIFEIPEIGGKWAGSGGETKGDQSSIKSDACNKAS
jgi:hypothetical protein